MFGKGTLKCHFVYTPQCLIVIFKITTKMSDGPVVEYDDALLSLLLEL